MQEGWIEGRWGIRCSRDNPCFDRSRHLASQQLPNLSFGAGDIVNSH
ncbi:hypothetical protein [Pontiella sulfatireligans]